MERIFLIKFCAFRIRSEAKAKKGMSVNMKKKINVGNKRGSISLFVLLSALFFLVVVVSVNVSLKNKEGSINAQIAKVKSSYEKDVGNEKQIYLEKIQEAQRQLIVNPNKGTWRNSTQNTNIRQEEGYELALENPNPPTVVLDTDGGDLEDEVESITFIDWQLSGAGSLSGNTYTFGNGNATLTARYNKTSIKLPNATKEGYIFARMV